MAPPRVWCLLIDHEKNLIGAPFRVVADDIESLRKEVKIESPTTLKDVDAYRLVVWHCKAPRVSTDADSLEEILDKIDLFDKTNVARLSSDKEVKDLGLVDKETLLVQTPDDRVVKRKHDDSIDTYERLKKAKLVQTAPSKVAAIPMYRSIQKNPDEKILDDRPSPDKAIPPIGVLYYGFGHFLDICRGKADVSVLGEVDRQRFKSKVDEFAKQMCSYCDNEDKRRDEGLDRIHKIFQSHVNSPIPRATAASIGGYRLDGHIRGAHGGACLIVEFKNEITGISSIPVAEAAAYVAQTHLVHMKQHVAVLHGWRVPCLGLTVVGCDVTFYAIIAIHSQYRVVPLTSTLSCLLEANDGDDRKHLYSAFTAASVLLARILADGRNYVNSPPAKIPNGCHQFPAVSRLHCYGSEEYVYFQIRGFHPDRQDYRWLYIADTADNEQILVKFTRHYSIDLHSFCAAEDYSPAIVGFERLPGGWFGVAMKYLPSATPLLGANGLREHAHRWIEELKTLVQSFHDANFVHGDLRDPNIICNGQKLLLIDFDWAGKADEVSYPVDLDDLNEELTKGRSSTDARITKADDRRVLETTIRKIRDRCGCTDCVT